MILNAPENHTEGVSTAVPILAGRRPLNVGPGPDPSICRRPLNVTLGPDPGICRRPLNVMLGPDPSICRRTKEGMTGPMNEVRVASDARGEPEHDGIARLVPKMKIAGVAAQRMTAQ